MLLEERANLGLGLGRSSASEVSTVRWPPYLLGYSLLTASTATRSIATLSAVLRRIVQIAACPGTTAVCGREASVHACRPSCVHPRSGSDISWAAQRGPRCANRARPDQGWKLHNTATKDFPG